MGIEFSVFLVGNFIAVSYACMEVISYISKEEMKDFMDKVNHNLGENGLVKSIMCSLRDYWKPMGLCILIEDIAKGVYTLITGFWFWSLLYGIIEFSFKMYWGRKNSFNNNPITLILQTIPVVLHLFLGLLVYHYGIIGLVIGSIIHFTYNNVMASLSLYVLERTVFKGV